MMVGREVEVYSDWTDHSPDERRFRSGSGYLLGGRLVVSAAHVVCPGGHASLRVAVQVRVGTGPRLLAATVVWRHPDLEVDVALLEVIDSAWPTPVWRHPVRWGRLVTTRARQRCEATGFPKVTATPSYRDSHTADGLVNPKTLVKASRYAMEVINPPAVPDPDGSRWAGMSGAGVLCNGLLTGIVVEDPAGFDSRRLVSIPVTACTSDPQFAELVAQHVGAVPIVESVELAGLAEPVPATDSPAGLLRADAAAAPFRARPELAGLIDWCHGPGWSSTRLVVGAGGQGKTRLARHLAGQVTGEGWATVVLGEHVGAADLTVLAEMAAPTLVIVDYAEGRTHQLVPLIQALDRAEAKVRLLLLARTAGAWRTERVNPAPQLAVLADDQIVVTLRPVEPTPAGREQAWRQAVVALAPRLAGLEGHQDIPWTALTATLSPPPLAGERYRTILAVQMHALAALLQAGDPAPVGGRDARDVLLDHESRYWTRVADRFGITLTPATRRCLVATATLWGAKTAVDAASLLAATLTGADPDTLHNVAQWLATLYQDGERYWSGMLPDPLAEYFLGTVLGPDGRCPTLITNTLRQASPAQLEHALTVLGRAHPEHPHLTPCISQTVLGADPASGAAAIAVAPRLEQPQPLLTALDQLIDTADIATLQEINDAFPRFSMLLGPATLKAAEALAALLRHATEADRNAYLPALAGSVNNLAIRLGEAGRYEQALLLAREAAAHYHDLARTNPDVFGSAAEHADRLVTALIENQL